MFDRTVKYNISYSKLAWMWVSDGLKGTSWGKRFSFHIVLVWTKIYDFKNMSQIFEIFMRVECVNSTIEELLLFA